MCINPCTSVTNWDPWEIAPEMEIIMPEIYLAVSLEKTTVEGNWSKQGGQGKRLICSAVLVEVSANHQRVLKQKCPSRVVLTWGEGAGLSITTLSSHWMQATLGRRSWPWEQSSSLSAEAIHGRWGRGAAKSKSFLLTMLLAPGTRSFIPERDQAAHHNVSHNMVYVWYFSK